MLLIPISKKKRKRLKLEGKTAEEANCGLTEDDSCSLPSVVDSPRSSNDEKNEVEPNSAKMPPSRVPFWTSSFALRIYACVMLAIVLKRRFVLYGIHIVVLHKFSAIGASWGQFVRNDPQTRETVRNIRRIIRIGIREGEKVLSGNYGRQVVAAYFLHVCTAPGESYIAYLLRYKMSVLNSQWIEELEACRERRHGYHKARSQRNVFG